MEKEREQLRWFTSSASAAGNCVEVAHLPGGGVAVRDSKNRARPAHIYTRLEWEAFLVGAKNGEFDLPPVLRTSGPGPDGGERTAGSAASGRPPFPGSAPVPLRPPAPGRPPRPPAPATRRRPGSGR